MVYVHPQDDSFWLDAKKYSVAEALYYQSKPHCEGQNQKAGVIDINLTEQVRRVKKILVEGLDDKSNNSKNKSKENEVEQLQKKVDSLTLTVEKLQNQLSEVLRRMSLLENKKTKTTLVESKKQIENKKKDDDDDVDLFGSDESEDEEAAKIREERVASYAAKKSKKPALIAKSSVILDVKPWDDETDMKLLEQEVRKVVQDGLLWGASKLVPLAYGIQKLQINCVIEDEKVSVDELIEKIQEDGQEYIQSIDVAAFNKI